MQVMFCPDCGEMFAVAPGGQPQCPRTDSHAANRAPNAPVRLYHDREKARKRPRI